MIKHTHTHTRMTTLANNKTRSWITAGPKTKNRCVSTGLIPYSWNSELDFKFNTESRNHFQNIFLGVLFALINSPHLDSGTMICFMFHVLLMTDLHSHPVAGWNLLQLSCTDLSFTPVRPPKQPYSC